MSISDRESRTEADDIHVRVAALQAATTWLAGIDPYPQGIPLVLDTAGRFEQWIRTGADG